MDITEYDEFYKWYKANERRFHFSQMTEVQIAYSAYLHGIEQSHKHGVMQAEGSDVEVDWDKNVKPKPTAEYKLKVISVQNSEGAAVGQRSVDTGVSAGCCDHVEWVVRLGILQCANCGKPH